MVYIYRRSKNPLKFPKLPKRGKFNLLNYSYPFFYGIIDNADLFFLSCKLIRGIA
jgi:hypothetical protein